MKMSMGPHGPPVGQVGATPQRTPMGNHEGVGPGWIWAHYGPVQADQKYLTPSHFFICSELKVETQNLQNTLPYL